MTNATSNSAQAPSRQKSAVPVDSISEREPRKVVQVEDLSMSFSSRRGSDIVSV